MSCSYCNDLGYVTEPGNENAVAAICRCSKNCRLCGGSGLIIDRSSVPPVSRPCSCNHLRRRVARFNEAGIPAIMHNKDVDRIEEPSESQSNTIFFVRKFMQDYEPGTRGFLLWGRPGTGKTHIVCAVARYLILEKGYSVRFVDFFQLLSDLKAGYGEGRSEAELINPLVEPDVLIIDELGKGRATEWEISILDQLVSRRYNSGKTVIATSNLNPDVVENGDGRPSLADRVDERIYSRLCDLCDFIQVQGEDYRKREKFRASQIPARP